HSILKELYTTEEAEVVVRMPYTLSSLERIARTTGIEKTRLQGTLDGLGRKGLVLDLYRESDGQFYYMPSPLLIGLFEFTMMRTGNHHDKKECSRLFQDYFHFLYPANFSHDEQISVLRVIPVEETIRPSAYTEFMDYEKASSLIENSRKFAIGLCSCRNEKYQNGEKQCDAPLENCSALGFGADYLIRHGLGREVSKSEMRENFERSKELGLVFCAENTKRNPTVICHCCKCCCNYLAGANKFGFANSAVTSNFLSTVDETLCKGCGKCVDLCPVNAIGLGSAHDPKKPKKKKASIDVRMCVGCGVCALKCPAGAIEMINRGSRVIHPETTFERIILLSLERGNLQNQVFDNPESVTQEFMRSFFGAFLRLPTVKRVLMSDMFRSTFLSTAKVVATLQGKGWMLEI
ncbi:MAG TPA: 4Fe-4S binding protein, partial [Deltaproteobacteria bacterium]|nr:4Fe-4S binding protein [Deltaproteobacteria bacterium]